jgi:ABC-type microcin C transport system permease subunit YejE
MSPLDFVVLIGTMVGIAAYGIWRTRGRRDLRTYLQGAGTTPWFLVGLSVMATQASAVTFLSTPGQGYQGGLGFVQIYFGMPLALIIIAVLGPSLPNLILVLAITSWVDYARVVRAEVLSVREREFVEAARAIGVRNARLLPRHILPNVYTAVIVIATVAIVSSFSLFGKLGSAFMPER